MIPISENVLRALPPAFLMLAVINIIAIGSVFYLVSTNQEQRNAMLTRIIDKCLINQQ